MIFQDMYESRISARREKQEKSLINRLRQSGLAVPGDISVRTLWQMTEKDADAKVDFIKLPIELRNWMIDINKLPEIGRKRVYRSLDRLQKVINPDDPFVRVYKFGSFEPEKEKLIPQSSFRDFNWLYPTVDSVRSIEKPSLLEEQIGYYEARLVIGILK